jgi:thiol-disulfide isomerase/thioredoxin/outer membrane lipoprotein-sorting protein
LKIQNVANLSVLLLSIVFTSATNAEPAAPAVPATPAAPAAAPDIIDPKALALLSDVDKTMRNAAGITANFTMSRKSGAAPTTFREGSVAYLKPNYMHVDSWVLKKDEVTGKMVRDGNPDTNASDGKTLWDVAADGEYRKSAADPTGKAIPSNLYDPLFGVLEPSSSWLRQIDEMRQAHAPISLTYGGKQEWEGKTYDVVDLQYSQSTQHLYIGSDKLVHRQAFEFSFGVTGDRAIRNIKINPKITAKHFAYTPPASAHQPPPPPTVLANGSVAPDFLATTPDGKEVHLSDFKGKPIVLDFWATWCGPCKASMPHLNNVYKQVKDKDVVVLAVCVLDNKDAYDKWVADNKTTYEFPTLFDPAGTNDNNIAAKLYKVSGIPTQFVIDKDGKIAASSIGYGGEQDHRLEAALSKLGVELPAHTDVKS